MSGNQGDEKKQDIPKLEVSTKTIALAMKARAKKRPPSVIHLSRSPH